MDEDLTILGIALVVLGYGYFSRLFSRYNISGPMIFTTVGILLSPLVFGVEAIRANGDIVQTVAEIALILVLFSDAASLRRSRLRREWQLPVRLLFIGMPITIFLGTVAAYLFFPQEPMTYLLMLALILAPTDAALGKAVVTDPKVPEEIRSTINVESGLNDGIVFPMLITVVAVIVSSSQESGGNAWILYVVRQIVFGALAGMAVGYVGARLSAREMARNRMEESYQNLIPLALAIFSYYLAEFLSGNGFIAAFFAGLYLGNFNEALRAHVQDFAESEGELLILFSFLMFGLAFVPESVPYWNPATLGYALLSLTVLRMLPVALCLIGTKLDMATRLFIGWFGPRGIASLLYMLIVVHEIGSVKGHETVYAVISLTILLSIFLHGLSASPLAAVYGRRHGHEQAGHP
jgi:NhaP-type Na+/H+ or K+/H+ antiporter